jgi:hypothetical protein
LIGPAQLSRGQLDQPSIGGPQHYPIRLHVDEVRLDHALFFALPTDGGLALRDVGIDHCQCHG